MGRHRVDCGQLRTPKPWRIAVADGEAELVVVVCEVAHMWFSALPDMPELAV